MNHKIINRYKEYVPGDCFAYTAECNCGEHLTGWSEQEVDEKVDKHLKDNLSK